MFRQLISVIKSHDPDMLVGYDPERSSFGYLVQRSASLDFDLSTELSRVTSVAKASRNPPKAGNAEDSFGGGTSSWNDKHSSPLNIVGRIVIGVWRLIRADLATVTSFTFENVASVVLKERHPKFSDETLTKWWTSNRYGH